MSEFEFDEDVEIPDEEIVDADDNYHRTILYEKLKRVYFLPAFNSHAITLKALTNLLARNGKFYCPSIRGVEIMNKRLSSNYHLEHIHIIVNAVTFQETGLVLFFDKLANWTYYQTLLFRLNKDMFKKIYDYKYYKPATNLKVENPFLVNLLMHKPEGNNIYYGPVNKGVDDKWGTHYIKQKAKIEDIYMYKEVNVRKSDGLSSHYKETAEKLFTRVHTVLFSFVALENEYSQLSESYKDIIIKYPLQLELAKLRVHPNIWANIIKDFPLPDTDKLKKKLERSSSLNQHVSRNNPQGYNDYLQNCGYHCTYTSLESYWADINASEALQNYMNKRYKETQEKMKEDVQRTEIFVSCLLRYKNINDDVVRYNNIAWLLYNRKEDIKIIKDHIENTNRYTDLYYWSIQYISDELTGVSVLISEWMFASEYFVSVFMEKRNPIKFINSVFDFLVRDTDIHIKDKSSEISRFLLNRIGLNDFALIYHYQVYQSINQLKLITISLEPQMRYALILIFKNMIKSLLLHFLKRNTLEHSQLLEIGDLLVKEPSGTALTQLSTFLTTYTREFNLQGFDDMVMIAEAHSTSCVPLIQTLTVILDNANNPRNIVENQVIFKRLLNTYNEWTTIVSRFYTSKFQYELIASLTPPKKSQRIVREWSHEKGKKYCESLIILYCIAHHHPEDTMRVLGMAVYCCLSDFSTYKFTETQCDRMIATTHQAFDSEGKNQLVSMFFNLVMDYADSILQGEVDQPQISEITVAKGDLMTIYGVAYHSVVYLPATWINIIKVLCQECGPDVYDKYANNLI